MNIIDMREWVRRKVQESPREARSALGVEREYEVEAVLKLFGPNAGGLDDPEKRRSVEKFATVGLKLVDRGDYLGAAYCAMSLLGARQADRLTERFTNAINDDRKQRRMRRVLILAAVVLSLAAFAAGFAAAHFINL